MDDDDDEIVGAEIDKVVVGVTLGICDDGIDASIDYTNTFCFENDVRFVKYFFYSSCDRRASWCE